MAWNIQQWRQKFDGGYEQSGMSLYGQRARPTLNTTHTGCAGVRVACGEAEGAFCRRDLPDVGSSRAFARAGWIVRTAPTRVRCISVFETHTPLLQLSFHLEVKQLSAGRTFTCGTSTGRVIVIHAVICRWFHAGGKSWKSWFAMLCEPILKVACGWTHPGLGLILMKLSAHHLNPGQVAHGGALHELILKPVVAVHSGVVSGVVSVHQRHAVMNCLALCPQVA